MGKTYLHREKGKSKHGVYGDNFEDYPLKVRKYYDRHCGTIDDKISKIEKIRKEIKKEKY